MKPRIRILFRFGSVPYFAPVNARALGMMLGYSGRMEPYILTLYRVDKFDKLKELLLPGHLR